MKRLPIIKAKITFLGVRIFNEKIRYMPHIVIQDPSIRKAVVEKRDHTLEVRNSLTGKSGRKTMKLNTIIDEYIGVAFTSGPTPTIPNKEDIFELTLMYYPHPIYEKLKQGVTFTIREGAKIVGFGEVIKRNDAEY